MYICRANDACIYVELMMQYVKLMMHVYMKS